LAAFEIPLPPITTQHKISAVLSAYDDLVENNNRRIKILEEMAQRIYREWFVDFRYPGHEGVPLADSAVGPIPTGWALSRIEDCCAVVLGGTPSRSIPEYWTDGTVPWCNSGLVNELRVIAPSELITEEALKRSATKMMPKGTTLIAITGATLGQVSLLEIDACANQSVVGVIPQTTPQREYLHLYITEMIGEIIGAASGGAQQHINKGVVSERLIPVPPHALEERFRTHVGPLFDQIGILLWAIASLRDARDLLLPRLVSGEIDVTDLDIAMPEAA
jgi:type I restriction enzyme S subunit